MKHSDRILAELRETAGRQRLGNIERVVEACEHLKDQGRIRLRAIETYIRDKYGNDAGPRAQSISNERKLDIGIFHYVQAKNNECSKLKTSKSTYAEHLDLSIEAINNMDIRNAMRELHSRCNALQRSLLRAKHVMKTFQPGIDIEAVLAGRPPSIGATVEISNVNIKALRIALRLLTDPETLSRCGLKYNAGSLCRKSGTCDELLPAHIVTKLFALLAQLPEL